MGNQVGKLASETSLACGEGLDPSQDNRGSVCMRAVLVGAAVEARFNRVGRRGARPRRSRIRAAVSELVVRPGCSYLRSERPVRRAGRSSAWSRRCALANGRRRCARLGRRAAEVVDGDQERFRPYTGLSQPQNEKLDRSRTLPVDAKSSRHKTVTQQLLNAAPVQRVCTAGGTPCASYRIHFID
jgi:hypothetical protein